MSKKPGIITRFIRGLFHRSLENPNTSLVEAFNEMFGGGKADSGIEINSRSILGYSPIWKGVNLIARDVAKLPLVVYQRVESGKERAPDHPAYRLLHKRPNEWQTAFQFRLCLQERAILRGNGFAYIARNGAGAPMALIPLSPNGTFLVRETDSIKKSGTVWCVTGANMEIRIPYRDIFHIRGMGTDLSGYSLADIARDSLGLGMAAQKFGARFFANGANPSVTLETDQKLDDEAYTRLGETWNSMHKGMDNAHKAAVLEQGLHVKPFSISNKDSQFMELRAFERVEVANWLLLQPHKVGDSSRTAYNSLEQENRSYLDESLDPWLVTWEQEAWCKLLTEPQKARDTHVVEFIRDALLRADTTARYEAYAKAISNGIMSPDEARARENMNAIPNGNGDKYYMPVNLAAVGEPAPVADVPQDTPIDGADAPQDDDNTGRSDQIRPALDALLCSQISRMVTRIRNARKRGNLDADKERGVITSACIDAMRVAGLSLGCALDADMIADRLLAADAKSLAGGNLAADIAAELIGSK